MPQTVKRAVASGDPIRAYGPDNIVIAESRDSGKTWTPTKEGLALEERRRLPVPRVFNRRIAAVVDAMTPALERRIATPFSILHETGTLAGWAPYATLAALDDGALDGIVIPGVSATPERLTGLRRVGRSLLLDLDETTSLAGNEGEMVFELLPLVDAVTVPGELFAARLRPHHPHVFVIPDLLRADVWRERRRQNAPRGQQLVIGAPSSCPPTVEEALDRAARKHGERVRIERYDWWTIESVREPDHYLGLDIVVLPAPPERHMAAMGPLLPAMAAGCGIVADALWPVLRNRGLGWVVGLDTPVRWTGALDMAIRDSQRRITMGRLASSQARRWTPDLKLNQIFLPYRLMVRESSQFSLGEGAR
jgi:hypothetical protein